MRTRQKNLLCVYLINLRYDFYVISFYLNLGFQLKCLNMFKVWSVCLYNYTHVDGLESVILPENQLLLGRILPTIFRITSTDNAMFHLLTGNENEALSSVLSQIAQQLSR